MSIRPLRLYVFLLFLFPLMLALSGCGSGGQPGGEKGATLVTVSLPVEREVSDVADFTGQTQAVNSVNVQGKVWGFIQKVNFREGTEVNKGDILFEIDPRDYQAAYDQANAKVAVDLADLKYRDAEYARTVVLQRKDAATVEDLEKNRSSRDVALANVEASRAALETARLNLGYTKVRAEVSGVVGRDLVTPGNLIQAGGQAGGTLLTTIVSMDPIYTLFDIDELTMLRIQEAIRKGKFNSARDAAKREPGFLAASTVGLLAFPDGYGALQAAISPFPNKKFIVIPVHIGLANETGYPHQGSIDFVNNQVNPRTGTIQVRGIFPNPDRALTPGLFVRVRVSISAPYKALTVNERAIDSDGEQKALFVVNAKNEVEYRPVKLGALFNGMRVIEEGLKADEWVIVDGLQRVRAGVTVNPKQMAMPMNPGAEK